MHITQFMAYFMTCSYYFEILIFTEKYFLLMERVQIFAYNSLIIKFKGILVKLKNIAHEISVE